MGFLTHAPGGSAFQASGSRHDPPGGWILFSSCDNTEKRRTAGIGGWQSQESRLMRHCPRFTTKCMTATM